MNRLPTVAHEELNQLFEVPVRLSEEQLLQTPMEYHPIIPEPVAIPVLHSWIPKPENTNFEVSFLNPFLFL